MPPPWENETAGEPGVRGLRFVLFFVENFLKRMPDVCVCIGLCVRFPLCLCFHIRKLPESSAAQVYCAVSLGSRNALGSRKCMYYRPRKRDSNLESSQQTGDKVSRSKYLSLWLQGNLN